VAATTYGPTQAPIVFGVGVDHKVYEKQVRPNGTLLSGWGLVRRPVQHVVVALGWAQPILSALAPRPDSKCRPPASTPREPRERLEPGRARRVHVVGRGGNFGSGTPKLFGISQSKAFFARFKTQRRVHDGWTQVAPGNLQSLAAAKPDERHPRAVGARPRRPSLPAPLQHRAPVLWLSPSRKRQPVA